MERAAIDPAKIPELLERYDHALGFTPEQKGPYFTYYFNKNSRQEKLSPMEVIQRVLQDVEELLLINIEKSRKML